MRSFQQALLSLLRHARSLDRERLMALTCLMRSQLVGPAEPFYDFVEMGGRPWSFSLVHDLGKLAAAGWIISADGLVAAGPRLNGSTTQQAASWALAEALPGWWRGVRRLRPDALRSRCARCRPAAGAHLGRDAPTAGPAVMTAGYQGLSLEAFLGRLLQAGIMMLIDVRAHPTARRFGFHRSTLARSCRAVGIRYEHVPELGIGTDQRRGQTAPAQRQRLFRHYLRTVLADHPAALVTVTAWMRESPAVLVCLEADPMDCHRTHLGRLLAETLERPLIDLGSLAAR